MLKPGACVGAPRLLLSEVQTLVGPPQEISRLELALEGEHELRGRLFAGESGEAQVVLSLAATAAGAKAAAAAENEAKAAELAAASQAVQSAKEAEQRAGVPITTRPSPLKATRCRPRVCQRRPT